MYGAKYYIQAIRFKTGETWKAEIEEENYSGSAIELIGSASPIVIKYINNEEEKIPDIQASFCTVSFVSENFDLKQIVNADDKKYRISIYQGSTLQWRGFISSDDCSEDYTDGYRQYVLTATDGLGFLKDEEYKLSDGTTGVDAYGLRTLLNCIADCLHYTYTELPIQIECVVFEANMSNFGYENPYDQCKLHTKLFLYAPEGPKNMYECLQVIMQTFQCTLFQQFGEWHVKRKIDRFDTSPAQSYLYSWPDLTPTQVTRRWDMYKVTDFVPINASHTRSFIKPSRSSSVTHKYIIGETPDNPSHARGSLISSTSTERVYSVDFWECLAAPLNNPVAGGDLFRYETLDANGNLSETYIEFPCFNVAGRPFIRNVFPILIDQGDTITISGQIALDTSIGASGGGCVYFRARPENETLNVARTYDYLTREWGSFLNTDAGTPAVYINTGGSSNPASDIYQAFEVTSAPFPSNFTKLYVWLTSYAGGSGVNVRFKDVKITVNLKFNGAEIGVIGEKSTSSLSIISRKTTDKDIRLGDSPKRVLSSALWRGDNDTLLTAKWGRLSDTGRTERLININSQDLQKANWRIFQKVEGDFLGVTFDSNTKLIGPGNSFTFDTPLFIAHIPTNIEIDVINNTFRATLEELFDTIPGGQDDGQTYYDTTEFKYLFDERS